MRTSVVNRVLIDLPAEVCVAGLENEPLGISLFSRAGVG